MTEWLERNGFIPIPTPSLTDDDIKVLKSIMGEPWEKDMSELIDRQAAIEIIDGYMNRLAKHIGTPTDNERYAFSRGTLIGVEREIKALPSAEQWIPCSKRLPKIGEHYVSEPCIVYCSNGAYGFAELEENIFGQVGWNCERDDEYHEPLGEVLAWMPLPSPYKEEQ